MARWVVVEGSSTEEVMLSAKKIALVKRAGTNVTFVMENGAKYTWKWNGTALEWATLVEQLELDDAV